MINKERFLDILSKFPTVPPILVIGDVGVDKYSQGIVQRISPEAPVPILEVQKEWLKLGLAANVSDNLKSLGVDSTLCSVIGNDKNANFLEELLEESKLKTWGLVRADERMTTYKERVVTEVQQICRIDYETKTELDQATDQRLFERVQEFSQNHGSVIIEDYGKGVLTEWNCQKIIALSKEKKIRVCIDPSRSTNPLFYKGAHLLKPNHLEAKMIAQTLGGKNLDSPEKLARFLVERLELEKVVITLGAQGMGMIDTLSDNQYLEIPTVAQEVFDVSGAGDTAISAICAALDSGATLEEAAWLGNCASGVVVSKRGTALVTIEELKKFYQKLQKKVDE